MRKILITMVLSLLVVPIVAGIPAMKTETSLHSTKPYWVKSNNPLVKSVVKIRHEFRNYFSASLTPTQAKLLRLLGIEVEPVKAFYITKPTCNYNGICEPELGENPSCSDCKTSGETSTQRTCYPSEQIPWNIKKVKGGSGGANVDIAVLDTGVYTDHPDLKRRIIDCKDFTKGPKVKNSCKDGNGHGTHVAGIIAADGGEDGKGIIGVAPEANIMAYKVCNDIGVCYEDDIAAAIDYAAAHGAEIISMSFGSDVQSIYIKDAIDRNPGVLYVAAAGNDREDGIGSIDYPAAYVKVIAVAAFDSSDKMASFSSLGVNDGDWIIEEKEIEFAAPGVNIESTWNDGCYKVLSGTSMATPHISGLAAKYWQGNASATRAYLQELAKNYTLQVFDYGQPGDDIEAGFGLPVPVTG